MNCNELQALLIENDAQTQEQLIASLNVAQRAILTRLRDIGKIREAGKLVNILQNDYVYETLITKLTQFNNIIKKDWRPIHYACNNGDIELLKILIKNKCNIEARDKWNKRPIHLACQNGFVDIVELLIKYGCNFEAKDRWNKRPSHWSCEYGEIETLKILLKNRCDIEAVDKNARRPIHWACRNDRLDIINMLIKQQCQLDVVDAFGFSPLDISKEKENSIMKDILQNGQHINKLISVLELKCLTNCDHHICPKALHLKQFRTGDIIGTGGFGKVYRYKKSINNREFAAKFILIEKTNYKYIEDNINKYKDQLNHHRIIKYYGAIETSLNLCIFMEYLPGGSLRDKLCCNRPFPDNKTIQYSKQIIEGISFLHNNNVIHRDIKPDNILLTNDDNIKIADLGIGRMLMESENNLHMASTCIGTTLYMAPEIFSRKPYTFSADIWSVGITIYEMNIGSYALNLLCHTNPSNIESNIQNCSISENMKSFLIEMLKFNPELRTNAARLLNNKIFKEQYPRFLFY